MEGNQGSVSSYAWIFIQIVSPAVPIFKKERAKRERKRENCIKGEG